LPERALSRLAMSASYALIIGVGTSDPWIAAAGLRDANEGQACIPDGVAGREVCAPRDHHGLVICRREWQASRTEPRTRAITGIFSEWLHYGRECDGLITVDGHAHIAKQLKRSGPIGVVEIDHLAELLGTALPSAG
jgi:hypothetical protein